MKEPNLMLNSMWNYLSILLPLSLISLIKRWYTYTYFSLNTCFTLFGSLDPPWFVWFKWFTLGKYSKMKIGIFCIHRPEALGPPPLRVQFCEKKLTPIFFFGNWIYDCQNEFYTWSHWKIYFFSSVIMLYFSINWPFRRACRCHFQSCFNSCIYAQNTYTDLV